MLNKVILIGRIGQDPEIRTLDFGTVVNTSLATNAKWRDKNTGEKKERTTWHNLDFYGKTAEIAAEYLQKGMLIYAEGELVKRDYTDKNDIARTAVSINVKNMQMLSGGREQRAQFQQQPQQQQQMRNASDDYFADTSDMPPF